MKEQPSGFATRALHVGQGPDSSTGAVVQPIHLATTFRQEEVGKTKGYEYSRSGNPTRSALEECLASLEGATTCLAYASGLAASTNLMLLLNPGDHVVYMEDVYGGTFRLFDKVMKRYGITFTAVDASQLDAVEAALTDRTRLLWLETPTNPLLRLVDIAAVTQLARRRGILSCVDNTFATPYLQRPLELGADLVLHSSTKYLGGHSDVVGGAIMTSNDSLVEPLRFHQNAVGAVPAPFDCWLLLRGLKTLSVRMRQHCENARTIASYLESHPAVERVHYPGLTSHPHHKLAKKQMADFGGMISFEVRDEAIALDVLRKLELFTLAESLGAVESLAEHPPLMTHASIPKDIREQIGIRDGLIRLSVGIEDIEDLVADLDQALPARNHQ